MEAQNSNQNIEPVLHSELLLKLLDDIVPVDFK